jgi:hypothetical protein
MAKSLKVKPSDLTRIAARNGGTFPLMRIERIISGEEQLPMSFFITVIEGARTEQRRLPDLRWLMRSSKTSRPCSQTCTVLYRGNFIQCRGPLRSQLSRLLPWCNMIQGPSASVANVATPATYNL